MKTRCPLSPTFLPPGKCPGVLPPGGAKVWKGVGVKETSSIVPVERIEKAIFMIRGHKVMLSSHLADLYGVVPKVLVQAVNGMGTDFLKISCFNSRLASSLLESQIVTSSWGCLRRARPYAFTEQGVAMLSSVLRSKRAVQVNIEIMRAFVRLREILATHHKPAGKLEDLEERIEEHDNKIVAIFEAIRRLMAQPDPPKKKIGFMAKESRSAYGMKNGR